MLHTPNSTRDLNFLLCRTGHAPVEEWELEVGNVKSMEMMAKQRANTAEFLGAGKRLHALVVGGTGMLRGLTLALAGKGYIVSVIARDATRLRALADAAAGLPGGVNPVPLDYREGARLRAALREAIAQHGRIVVAVCWIHSTAPHALEQIAGVIEGSRVPCRLFHVRGSAAANPAEKAKQLPAWLEDCPHVQYRQVILGFVVEPWGSRWLTHEEISGGVLTAVQNDAAFHIVGTVEPWSMRP